MEQLPAFLKFTVGQCVKRWREYRGWTATEYARKAGVSKPYLSDLENDKTQTVGKDKLLQLADGLGIPPQYLHDRVMPEDAHTPAVGREALSSTPSSRGGAAILGSGIGLGPRGQRPSGSGAKQPGFTANNQPRAQLEGSGGAEKEQLDGPNFGDAICQVLSIAGLSVLEQRRAEQLILENARAVCRVLAQDPQSEGDLA